MLRILSTIIIGILFTPITAWGQEREILYKGLGMTLQLYTDLRELTDSMTDFSGCSLFIDSDPISFAISEFDSYLMSYLSFGERNSSYSFSPPHEALIRIDDQTPFSLSAGTDGIYLGSGDSEENQAVVRAILDGNRIRISYVERPENITRNVEVSFQNVGHVYDIAISDSRCGWKAIGRNSDLEVGVIQTSDTLSYPRRNPELMIAKRSSGTSCEIDGFEIEHDQGKWSRANSPSRREDLELIIYNRNYEEIYRTNLPEYNENGEWQEAEEIVRLAWNTAPYGFVYVGDDTSGNHRESALPLYGFREIWEWGMENCDLPGLN